MRKRNGHTAKTLLVLSFVLRSDKCAIAQNTTAPPKQAEVEESSQYSIEGLYYVGRDAAMPPLSDSPVGIDSDFRRAMFNNGMALRLVTELQYSQNTLDGPVPPGAQVYTGQRPFGGTMFEPLFTADLRQLHLRHAQLNITGVWKWVSWNPAGPKAFGIHSLFIYKENWLPAWLPVGRAGRPGRGGWPPVPP